MLNLDLQPITARSYCWPASTLGQDGYTAACEQCGDPCLPGGDGLCVTCLMRCDVPPVRTSRDVRNDGEAIARRRYGPKQRHPPKVLTEAEEAAKHEKKLARDRAYYHGKGKAKQLAAASARAVRKKEAEG